MGQRIWQVDAFTSEPFRGNPAGVCVMDAPAAESWMQNVAMEMNLAETAFTWPEGQAWRLRWFTPTQEVDLCGHATLATSHILWESGILGTESPAVYETRSGRLTARRDESGITINLPADPPAELDAPEALLRALGIREAPMFSGQGRLGWLLELEDESTVRELAPDFRAMREASDKPVCATALSSGPREFVSRFFAPTMGIDEDPVTGAAHCCLAPYWQQRLKRKGLVGFQASARGGEVQVVAEGDRVALTGQAVTVLRGELT